MPTMKFPALLLLLVSLGSAPHFCDAFVPLLSATQCKAASVKPDGTIDACITQFGDVRASCGAPCRRGEESFSWNQQGPPGDDGLVADANLQCAPGEFMTGLSVTAGVANITCEVATPPPPPTSSPTPTPTSSPTVTPTPSPTATATIADPCTCEEGGFTTNCFNLVQKTLSHSSGDTGTFMGFIITDGTTGTVQSTSNFITTVCCLRASNIATTIPTLANRFVAGGASPYYFDSFGGGASPDGSMSLTATEIVLNAPGNFFSRNLDLSGKPGFGIGLGDPGFSGPSNPNHVGYYSLTSGGDSYFLDSAYTLDGGSAVIATKA